MEIWEKGPTQEGKRKEEAFSRLREVLRFSPDALKPLAMLLRGTRNSEQVKTRGKITSGETHEGCLGREADGQAVENSTCPRGTVSAPARRAGRP